MKRCIADGSVGFPHVRVGHRQASKKENPERTSVRGFFVGLWRHDFLAMEESCGALLIAQETQRVPP